MPGAKSTDLRRKGRMLALQALYASDLRGRLEDSSLDWLDAEEASPRRATTFAHKLIRGVANHQPELDQVIQQYAPAWPVAQIAPVDRNILRIALFELLHSPDIPPKTAINEAVELAKGFGSESSSRFVNGVLGSVMAGLEVAELPMAGPPS